MYPYKVFLGLTLYDICLCAGIILCFVVFGWLADKQGVRRKIQSFSLMCGVAAVTLGYGSAVLFQALYNIKTLGRFEINESTGAFKAIAVSVSGSALIASKMVAHLSAVLSNSGIWIRIWLCN